MTDTITLPRSVVEQALEALFMYKPMVTGVTFQHGLDAMQALRAALEQPVKQEEPFTVLVRKHSWLDSQWEAAPRGFPDYGKQWASERVNVYLHPQPPRQPLTDEQIDGCWYQAGGLSVPFARAIERAHGIGGEA